MTDTKTTTMTPPAADAGGSAGPKQRRKRRTSWDAAKRYQTSMQMSLGARQEMFAIAASNGVSCADVVEMAVRVLYRKRLASKKVQPGA